MAALVLAVGVGSVARFCPQDLRFERGNHHPAAATTSPIATSTAPVIAPTTFTTIGSPDDHATPAAAVVPATPAKKKLAHRAPTRPATSASAAVAASASAAPALPDNPYAQAAQPETYGF